MFPAKSRVLSALAGTAALSCLSVAAGATDISGAGATFPYPIYAKWAEAYKAASGVGLNYQSIGSGGGIKQIKQGTVTFGASDKPLDAEDLKSSGLVQFPMIIGGVVPVINVPGVQPGAMLLDGPTLSGIYLGEILKWNDAAIRRLNPKLSLPDLAIAPIYRSDGSGTNFLFTDYLSKVSPNFKAKVGANTSVEWPAGIGAKGNEGVANMTAQTGGAIGYVEYAYAKQNRMSYVLLRNHDGQVVSPEIKAFQAAAANAEWAKAEGFHLILTDQPGAASWPITGASFILLHKENADGAAVQAALRFFAWSYAKGGPLAEQLDYVPLPPRVVSLVQDMWKKSVMSLGKPLWPVR
jgi:phosphate transport system substrate-binding protein